MEVSGALEQWDGGRDLIFVSQHEKYHTKNIYHWGVWDQMKPF